MLIGINYPWIDYGWDFGGAPPAWVAGDNLASWREKKRNQIEADFRLFASQRIFAVRWFLLADGLNYGTGESAPQQSGKKWVFDPLPAGHSFYSRLLADFEFVLQVCRRHNLKLFPSLIDFSWCHQGIPVSSSPGIIKGGRYDILCDPAKRQAFFERVLNPLLDASVQSPDSIYAWELINEPEWIIRRFWRPQVNRNVTRSEMRAFIAEGIGRINATRLSDGSSAIPSSVGFAHWETLDEWDAEGLGITLPQFHYYAQGNQELPRHPREARCPCVVGEFATAAGHDWPDLHMRHQHQTITNRLRCIEDKGHDACFMWSARATDPATRWTDEAHRELSAYSPSNGPDDIRG